MIRLTVNGTVHELEIPAIARSSTASATISVSPAPRKGAASASGACTVLLDGQMISSCIALAVFADGRSGHDRRRDRRGRATAPRAAGVHGRRRLSVRHLHPGQIVAAKALLDTIPNLATPRSSEWMLGNLCRCTGYYKIVESIQAAAQRSRA